MIIIFKCKRRRERRPPEVNPMPVLLLALAAPALLAPGTPAARAAGGAATLLLALAAVRDHGAALGLVVATVGILAACSVLVLLLSPRPAWAAPLGWSALVGAAGLELLRWLP